MWLEWKKTLQQQCKDQFSWCEQREQHRDGDIITNPLKTQKNTMCLHCVPPSCGSQNKQFKETERKRRSWADMKGKEGRVKQERKELTKITKEEDNRGQHSNKPWETQLQQKSVHQSHPSIHLQPCSLKIFPIWGDQQNVSHTGSGI